MFVQVRYESHFQKSILSLSLSLSDKIKQTMETDWQLQKRLIYDFD